MTTIVAAIAALSFLALGWIWIRAWRARRTDELLRRGFRAAHKRGWVRQ